MTDLFADVRYAWRMLRARPAFAALIVLTLGVGIGANSAIFSVVHALLLQPFPFKDPDRLVRIATVKGGEEGPLAIPELDDLQALSQVVESVAGYTDQGLYNASGFGAPEELQATITTHNLFDVLGVAPLVGTTFPVHYDRSRQFGLVISHDLWTRRFGRDPDIVGRTMTLDGSPGYVIHGVLPPEFNFPSHSDLFRSSGIAASPAQYERRDRRERLALVRLKPGVSIEQARGQIDALARRLEREFPATNAGLGFRVTPLRDLYVGQVRPYLLLLFGGVMLVLLIACANVVNLLLSRAISRDRELAIRLALGAQRGRIIRQLLTESLVLAILGGAVGLILAIAGVNVIGALVRMPLPPWMELKTNGPVLAFLTLISLVTGLAAGLVPALRNTTRLHDALKDGSRGSSEGTRQAKLRSLLIVSEVALAVVLLIFAGLMVRTVWSLQRVDPGFQSQSLLTFRVELGWRAYETHDKAMAFQTRMLDRLAALPGVEAVGYDTNLWLSGKAREPGPVTAEGQSLEAQKANPFVHWHVISPGYLQTMRTPLVAGRTLTDLDTVETMPVALLSARLARRLWPDEDPIGKRVSDGSVDATGKTVWLTVVGVAGDVQHQQLGGEASLEVYRSFRQVYVGGGWFVLRTRVDPASLARSATALVAQTDPNQSYFDVQTMPDRIAGGIWQRRTAGALFLAFAAIAALLSSIGLYSVLSYMVSQQRREVGVRIALGAQPPDVLRLVIGRGLRLTLIGLLAGLACAAPLAGSVAGLLYGVSPFDPLTFIGVPALLAVIATLACYLPARRATKIDPIVALRAE
jgi:putative ABC transport system permease protein